MREWLNAEDDKRKMVPPILCHLGHSRKKTPSFLRSFLRETDTQKLPELYHIEVVRQQIAKTYVVCCVTWKSII